MKWHHVSHLVSLRLQKWLLVWRDTIQELVQVLVDRGLELLDLSLLLGLLLIVRSLHLLVLIPFLELLSGLLELLLWEVFAFLILLSSLWRLNLLVIR